MVLTAASLRQLWGEPVAPPGGADPGPIAKVSTDSRGHLDGALFVPLVGERFDGHRFLAGALAAGAVAALAQRDRLDPEAALALAAESGRPLWMVDDTLAGLPAAGPSLAPGPEGAGGGGHRLGGEDHHPGADQSSPGAPGAGGGQQRQREQ